MQKEWIVTLHNKEDLDSFYEDMETEGGTLHIPGRAVPVSDRRQISRNTHYMLTNEEAMEIQNDPRVWGCDLVELIELTTKPQGWSVVNQKFSKDWFTDATDFNWGLLRHSEAANRSNWGANGTTNVNSDLTVTASGKNVDVVIVDGHIDPNHPEFAVNSDGTGGSRINQFNWFSLTSALGFGSNGTYTYDRSGSYTNSADEDDNNHGCHCGGTVAGNTQGWARDATIYNISPYGSNPNNLSSTRMWDYIREWHNTKAINAVTGRRNPTITNNSYGSSIPVGSAADNFGNITSITYRGTEFSPGRDLTTAELRARGCYAPSLQMDIPNYFTSRMADMQDAIDDGIIIIASAGNDSWKTVNEADQDWSNTYEVQYYGFDYTYFLNRGTGSGAGFNPVINVGATSNNVNEVKAPFSNCGNQVDIFAAGEGIQSSLHSGGVNDARNSSYQLGKYQGTSMSGPQVAGVVAILAEAWPNITQSEAQQWITDNSTMNAMYDSGTDDAYDRNSLQGADNKYLRWINQRPIDGNTLPKRNFKTRPATGKVYPRPNIRRRG
jgi:hypothetical protein